MKIFLESSTQCVKITKNVSCFKNYFTEFLKSFCVRNRQNRKVIILIFGAKIVTFDLKNHFKVEF